MNLVTGILILKYYMVSTLRNDNAYLQCVFNSLYKQSGIICIIKCKFQLCNVH